MRIQHILLLGCLLLGTTVMAQSRKPTTTTTWSGNKLTKYTNQPGEKAKPQQTVFVHLETWLGDSLFISTRRDFGGTRELTIPPLEQFLQKGRIPAVLEAVVQMAEGDSVTIYEKFDSAQIKGLPKGFEDIRQARYEIKMVDIVSPEEAQKIQEAAAAKIARSQAKGTEVAQLLQQHIADHKAGKLGNKLQKASSGLEYVILEKGSGKPIQLGDDVQTHYYGVLKSTGKMFDNSYDRGESAPFTVGMLIPGFNEGMTMLNRGGKAILFIPAALGYGEQGSGDVIPPNSDLVFYIDLK